jgi:hypothetical protein
MALLFFVAFIGQVVGASWECSDRLPTHGDRIGSFYYQLSKKNRLDFSQIYEISGKSNPVPLRVAWQITNSPWLMCLAISRQRRKRVAAFATCHRLSGDTLQSDELQADLHRLDWTRRPRQPNSCFPGSCLWGSC